MQKQKQLNQVFNLDVLNHLTNGVQQKWSENDNNEPAHSVLYIKECSLLHLIQLI
jgi:hypothetical protein